MTIKVEREALLQVLDQPPSTRLLNRPISNDDEFYLVDVCKTSQSEECPVEGLPDSSYDDDSVITASTSSLSSNSDDEDDKRVSFSPTLVTHEWTREYTPREEIADLYYSTEEALRFRQEYRLERKVLTELSIDPDSFPVGSDEIASLLATGQSGNKHRISRVVVLHNDKLETFFNNSECLSSEKVHLTGDDDFFDNESFWSGSITWY